MKRSRYIIIVLLYFFVFILHSVIPELLGDSISEFLLSALGKHYVPILIVLFVITSLVIVLYPSIKDAALNSKVISLDEPSHLDEIKNKLHQLYSDRLSSKMSKRIPMNLIYKYSTRGSSKSSRSFFVRNSNEQKNSHQFVLDTLVESNYRMLLVGKPGSGKSITMLRLSISILKSDFMDLLPIIVNAVTWHSNYPTIDNWLQEVYLREMGFSDRVMHEVASNICTLIIFDGLDEIDEEHRKSFLNALGEYGIDQNRKFIVTSRIKEYELTIDAPVASQIEIADLSLRQIRTELKSKFTESPENAVLLQLVNKNSSFRKVVKTPIYLNLAQSVLASRGTRLFHEFLNQSEAEIRDSLESIFINSVITRGDTYNHDGTLSILTRIAGILESESKVVFRISDLSVNWLKSIYFYSAIMVMFWLLSVILFLAFLNIFVTYSEANEAGLFMDYSNIARICILVLHSVWKSVLLIFSSLPYFVVIALTGGVIYKVLKSSTVNKLLPTKIGGLLMAKIEAFENIGLRKKKKWNFQVFRSKLKLGISKGTDTKFGHHIFFWLFIGSLSNQFKFLDLEYINTNLDSFITVILFLLILAILTYIIDVIINIYGFGYQELDNFIYSNHFSRLSDDGVFKYWALSLALFIEKKGPFNWIKYLNRLAEVGLMEKEICGWRFKHDIIQKYFVKNFKP